MQARERGRGAAGIDNPKSFAEEADLEVRAFADEPDHLLATGNSSNSFIHLQLVTHSKTPDGACEPPDTPARSRPKRENTEKAMDSINAAELRQGEGITDICSSRGTSILSAVRIPPSKCGWTTWSVCEQLAPTLPT